ncbi:MAG: phosphoglycerate dehydrogenase [Campylobacteraceae bacterium 4484_4]|nr:MAG: phosphoglycerate dehydrogenase [Campylobacteraceae bacterium 4484_4]
MPKKRIIVCDAIHNKGFELLENSSDIEYTDASEMPKEKLLEIVGDYDVAITRSSTDVDEKFLNAAKSLKAIVRAGVGVDNVDIEGCSKRGIIVMNVPTANTIAAVELTMAHMLAAARSFPNANNHLKLDRIWKREKWYGIELKDKKLGIIGFGNIGSRVGKRALAFEMDVFAYDPYIDPSKAIDLGVTYTKNFDDILDCDFITIHTPKNHETINMISYDEIAKMKDGVRLINCARGGLYNEDALYEGLKSGKIAYAGIDVFVKEPATDNKLLDLENISVTPHLGANTFESQEKIATQAVEQAINAARGISFPNALNLPVRENELPEFVKPYLELTQKLGYLAAQINVGAIKSLKVEAEGEIAYYLDSLTTFALVGSLKESMGEKINYVNAEFVAQENGIELRHARAREISEYKNRVEVKVITDEKSIEIGGTIFSDTIEKIININKIKLDFKPKGKMIFFSNLDRPGVIMKISQILAERGINIADFRLGRDRKGEALAVVLVDEAVDKEVLKAFESLEECNWVSYAVL